MKSYKMPCAPLAEAHSLTCLPGPAVLAFVLATTLVPAFGQANWTLSGSKLTVPSTTQVGIGTTNPGVNLDVLGRVLITGNLAGQEALVVNQGATSGSILNLRQGGTSKLLVDYQGRLGIGGNTLNAQTEIWAPSGREDVLNLFQNSNKMFSFQGADNGTGAYLAMYNSAGTMVNKIDTRTSNVTYFNGSNVGIGTITPAAVLHVQKDGILTPLLLVQGNAAGNNPLKALTLRHVNTPSSNQVGQALDIDFSLEGPSALQYTAGQIRLGKQSDFMTTTNIDSYMAFSLAQDNNFSEKMRISSEGNVGIGRTPRSRLDVNGDAIVSGSLILEGEGKYVGSAYGGSNSDYWKIFMDGQSTDNGALHIRSGDNGNEPIFFEQNSYDGVNRIRMTVAANGKVGIGTDDPQETLHVGGNAKINGTMEVASDATLSNLKTGQTSTGPDGPAGAYIGFKNLSSLPSSSYALAQFSTGGTAINAAAGSNVVVGIGGGTLATFSASGLKMAGTATITAGTVVATNWQISQAPDYVFEKDYQPAPLNEVESFVQKNKHLPEIPSARQMKTDGLDLVKMNFLLLKKVEELTLHAIRQEKEMKRQAAEIHDLKSAYRK